MFVIDRLEAIQVDHGQRQWRPGALYATQLVFQALGKGATVGQSGKVIGKAQASSAT